MAQALILAWVLLVGWCAASAEAATYYVKKTGSDANSCATAQNVSTPKLTIASALACLTAAGDTLRIGQGTYSEFIKYTQMPVSGTASDRITITKIDGENRPLLTPAAGCYGIQIHQSRNWITFDGIDINGQSLTSCGLTQGSSLVSAGSDDGPTGVIFRNMDIGYSQSHNLFNGDGLLLENLVIHHAGWYENTLTGTPGANGIYASKLRNSIIRRVETHNNMCLGIRIYNSASNVGISANNNIIEYAYAHDNGTGVGLDGTSTCGGGVQNGGAFLIGDDNNTLRFSVGQNTGSTGGRCIYVYPSAGGTTQSQLYNNTCVGHRWGVVIAAGVQTTTVKNNWLIDNGNNTSDNYIDAGTSTTASNNRTTGSRTDCAASSSGLTQKAGSLCTDAGVNVDLPYNGTNPDIGATEIFVFASCEVPSGAPGTIQITFTSNVGLLGDTLTTFTARRNGSSNALTGAASKLGDTIVSLPLTTTYGVGNTADISWSSGGLTDNVRIGGTINQPFVQTLANQSCTNNAGGGPAYVLSQERVQFRGVYGPENTTDIRGSDNPASYEVVVNGAARMRFVVKNAVANAPPFALYLRYSHDGGPYTVTPEAFGADHLAFCGNRYSDMGVGNGTPTTNQTVSSGTFVPAAVVLNANAIPTITGLNIGYKTEPEYCVSWDAAASGSYTFRLYEQSGTPLGDYLVTPSVIIAPPRGGGMP